MTVKESHLYLLNEETDKLLDQDKINTRALNDVEENGIVFIDEIDSVNLMSNLNKIDKMKSRIERLDKVTSANAITDVISMSWMYDSYDAFKAFSESPNEGISKYMSDFLHASLSDCIRNIKEMSLSIYV